MSTEETKAPFKVDESLLQQILDALPIGVWIADPGGLPVANNPAGRAIWQGERWQQPERYGEFRAWWSATGKPVGAAEWGMARAVAAGEVSHNEMVDIECFDGSRKTILSSAMPIRDAAGNTRAAVAVNQDVTELKHIQDDLELTRRQLEALSADVLAVQEQERKRLSMELHDEVGQTLSALKIAVETARRRCTDKKLAELLQQATEMTDTLVTDVREIARRLRPPPLDHLGLVAAVRWHLDRVGRATATNIQFNADTFNRRLPPPLELGCFRIIQEAVSNAVRHSRANSVNVDLDSDAHRLLLRVRDDGCGFDPGNIYSRRDRPPLGLLGMRERTATLGGELHVRSATDAGTEIRAVFPLEESR